MSTPARPTLVTALIRSLRSETEETEEAVRYFHLFYVLDTHLRFYSRGQEAIGVFRSIARWIPRRLGPFLDLRDVMCAGMPSDEPSVIS